MIPFSVLGKLRRRMIDALNATSLRETRRVSTSPALTDLLAQDDVPTQPEEPTRLHVLCRSLSQLRAVVDSGHQLVYADFQDIREYRDAVAIAHGNDATIFLATPRIQKPGEMGIFRSLMSHHADGILARNYAGIAFFGDHDVPVVADFSMNVANGLTAEYLIDRGVDRVTASYDLNREQLVDLVSVVPSKWLEVVIHQHMPMFHMEHCVFCAVLSPGTNKTNCGRPCDTMKVELQDRIGMQHPLTADVGCRNTLWNATPQSSAELVRLLQANGVRRFRVELLRENTTQTMKTIQLYLDLMSGNRTGTEVWQALKATNRVGVTRGTMEERNPLAII